MANYSADNLKRGIEAAEKNIKTFEEAIDKERETIKKFYWMIEQIDRKDSEQKKAEAIGKYIEATLEDRNNGN